MEVSYCSPLQLQENSFLFDCESLLEKPYDPVAYDPASDAGYFSAGSGLSPTSSVDSFCFSPTSIQAAGDEQDILDRFIFSSPEAPHLTQNTQTLPRPGSSSTSPAAKKSRSRYPGMKRQTASEREKLRMRDLTKSLNHLRTYLPPSVAPAGQTLTKIETLRLTIRYISYLSAQLGLSEEGLEQRGSPGSVEPPQTLNQFLGQPAASYSPQESSCSNTSADQMSSLQHAYQVCSYHGHEDGLHNQLLTVSSEVDFTSEYWLPQQPPQGAPFSGQC
ncbi:mesoderm posterior protein 1-like [Scophthalmus maximus]|uniref:mesoderm posterior protein 1-like n=1 Tax=Scophthalmus maximus TaxID=52904 RepID=UPI001FA8A0A4|nr:mesoderm posterior protein 1-like [Scophthalmus maximus]